MLIFVKSKVANNRIIFLILELKNIKFTTISIFSPFLCHEVRAWMQWMFVFWMLSFKPAFSSSSRGFLVPLHFLPLGWYHLHIWGHWYLPEILISACNSSSPAYKQSDNTQPWHTPFPMLNQSFIPCLVLTVASWPKYRFLRRQVRWPGTLISLKVFHSLLWSTQTRLQCSQWSQSRCFFFFFPGIPLLALWSN